MDSADLNKSLNSLAKYNRGLWKSDRQGKFITAKVREDFDFPEPRWKREAVAWWERALDIGRGELEREMIVAWSPQRLKGYGYRDPSKIRVSGTMFVIDGYGVLARATCKVKHPRSGRDDLDNYAPILSSAAVKWERSVGGDESAGHVYVEPTGKAAALERARRVLENKPLLDMIEEVPYWDENEILSSLHRQLGSGWKLSAKQVNLLNKILREKGVLDAVGQDVGEWEKAMRVVLRRFEEVDGPEWVDIFAKEEAEDGGKNPDDPRVRARVQSQMDSYFDAMRSIMEMKKKMKARTDYAEAAEGNWAAFYFVHGAQSYVDNKYKGVYDYHNREFRTPTNRTLSEQHPGPLSLFIETRYAIQLEGKRKTIPKKTMKAVTDLVRLARRMGM